MSIFEGHSMLCGIDEAGRGPVIGPMVIAAVCVNDETALKRLRVRDSKKHTPTQRTFLAEKIKEIAAWYDVLLFTAQEIDEQRKRMTLNELEVNGFVNVVKKIPFPPEFIYVDAPDVNEERFARDVSARLDFNATILSKHKADELYPVVSAASIIAKVTRDNEIKKIEKEIGAPIGSGYPSDPITIEFLKKYKKERGKFPPHVRKSWNTLKKIETLHLDDFA